MDEINFIKDNLALNEALKLILSTKTYSNYIRDIAEMIFKNQLDKHQLESLLHEHNIDNIEEIKEEILDLLIAYVNIILNDHKVTEIEIKNLKILKRFFSIKEGDFYEYRYNVIKDILQMQFVRMYKDDEIDNKEAIHKVGLQELFDLGYDQFLEFENKEVKEALQRGADLKNLDTVYNHTESKTNQSDITDRMI